MHASLLLLALVTGQVEHRIEGDVVQVVRSLPITVHIQTAGDLFFWTAPAGVTSKENGSSLQITAAPAGKHVLQVKIISINWEQKKVTQTDGKIELLIGQLPNPPPDPDDPDKPAPGNCAQLQGFAKDACQWLQLVPQRSRSRQQDLAQVFDKLAQGLEDGTWINYSQSNAWFLEQRDKVLSTQQQRDDWATFGSRLFAAIQPLARAPRARVIQFYREIAKGLQ